MTTFQQYLEMEYPLPKQDMIAVPFSSTAMENWGLIVFGEQFLTYDDVVISNAAMEANVLVMSHEMAHQWFGNLVTLDWWSDIWLNEGLATYVSYVGIDLVSTEQSIEFVPSKRLRTNLLLDVSRKQNIPTVCS